MDIDEPGCHREPGGVDHRCVRHVNLPDPGDEAVGECDVADDRWSACAIENRAPSDHEIDGHPLLPPYVERSSRPAANRDSANVAASA